MDRVSRLEMTLFCDGSRTEQEKDSTNRELSVGDDNKQGENIAYSTVTRWHRYTPSVDLPDTKVMVSQEQERLR